MPRPTSTRSRRLGGRTPRLRGWSAKISDALFLCQDLLIAAGQVELGKRPRNDGEEIPVVDTEPGWAIGGESRFGW